MKKLNVILDLDETLIHSLDKKVFSKTEINNYRKCFNYKEMDDDFTVFERPKLQTFLDLLFKKYNVSIWTAASKNYALFIIKNFILTKKSRQIDYIFFSYHCDISYSKTKSSKNIEIIWKYWGIKNYNKYNTIIIDDNKEVYDCQTYNCIRIKPFKVKNKTSLTDNYLNSLMKRLDKQFVLLSNVNS